MKTKQPMSDLAARRRRRWRSMVWSVAFILLSAMVLPLGGYMYAALQEGAVAQEVTDTNPRSNTWRAVREGVSGYSAVQGPEAGVLIQNGGQNWRALRNGPIATYGGWLIGAAVLGIVLFYLVRGTVKLDAPRTGRTVPRWTTFERAVHACTAIIFILMAITGLSLLFGRAVLIPVMGASGFAAWAALAMDIHNYLGPVFTGLVLLIVVMWVRHNIPKKEDIEWFKMGGGMVGKGHPHAGRMNAGEKVWFWFIATFGIAVCVSGLVLNFPNFDQTRDTMQLANLIHAPVSMIWIAFFLGHAYIGTLGSEGSFDAMLKGEVDETWAKQHHDLWYEEVKHQASESGQSSSSSSSGGVATA